MQLSVTNLNHYGNSELRTLILKMFPKLPLEIGICINPPVGTMDLYQDDAGHFFFAYIPFQENSLIFYPLVENCNVSFRKIDCYENAVNILYYETFQNMEKEQKRQISKFMPRDKNMYLAFGKYNMTLGQNGFPVVCNSSEQVTKKSAYTFTTCENGSYGRIKARYKLYHRCGFMFIANKR